MSFGNEMAAARRERKELDPADYVFETEYYVGPNPDMSDMMGDFCPPTGFVRHEAMGKCDHCGTPHHYGAIFTNKSTGDHLVIGNVCASNFFEFPSKMAYIQANAAKLAKAARIRDANNSAARGFLASRLDLQEAFAVCDHYIINDIKDKLFRYGSISDKQAALVIKIAIEELERVPEPEPVAIPESLTEGRHEFSGEVLALKWKDSDYGGSLKMLLRDDRGFKVWGTAFDVSGDASYDKGDRVSFMARLSVSKDDPCFGFFSRPTKGRKLEG